MSHLFRRHGLTLSEVFLCMERSIKKCHKHTKNASSLEGFTVETHFFRYREILGKKGCFQITQKCKTVNGEDSL